MSLALRLLALMTTLTLLTANGVARAAAIVIDGTKRAQTMQGFGTCTVEWDPNIAATYKTEAFQNMYMRDLGGSFLRMPISPGLSTTPDMDLNNLNINKLNFDFAAIALNGNLAKALNAHRLDQFKLIASVWSPPAWMKANNSTTAIKQSDGSYNDPNNYLLATRRDHFGKYLAAFCKGFEQKYGVPLYAISIQNELRFNEFYDSCVYTPQQYHDTIKAVGAQFKKWGITTKIQGPEDVGIGGDWFIQQEMSFINAVQNDATVSPYLNILSVHGYAGDGIGVGGSRTNWTTFHTDVATIGKELWMTEGSGEIADWLDTNGKQDSALYVGARIGEALAYGNCSAWLYWQIIDGSPSAGALTTNTDTTQKKYCAAKHFFRYIRPGAVRLTTTGDTGTFTASAYIHDANQTLTVVLVNTGTTAETVNLTLPAMPHLSTLQAWRTSASENFAHLSNVTIAGNKATLTVPAQSLVTLYGKARPDIMWRNGKTGDIADWQMNGGSPLSSTVTAHVTDASWQIVGAADLNGDGITDLLWQNVNTGELYGWYLNAQGVQTGLVQIAQGAGRDWRVVGTGDFNQDGSPDLLWRSLKTGDVAIWYLSGKTLLQSTLLYASVPLDWQIRGVADLNGDGAPDILWQNAQTGDVSVWTTNSGTVSSSLLLASGVPPRYQLQGVGDYSDDGSPDLLWRDTITGNVALWYMKGLLPPGTGTPLASGIPLDWQLVGTR